MRFIFSGYIKVNDAGIYTFSTLSDDGSKLFIDDMEVVNNDGDHGAVEKNGKALLKKGYHTICVLYYDGSGGNELKVMIQNGNGKEEEIPATMLFHKATNP